MIAGLRPRGSDTLDEAVGRVADFAEELHERVLHLETKDRASTAGRASALWPERAVVAPGEHVERGDLLTTTPEGFVRPIISDEERTRRAAIANRWPWPLTWPGSASLVHRRVESVSDSSISASVVGIGDNSVAVANVTSAWHLDFAAAVTRWRLLPVETPKRRPAEECGCDESVELRKRVDELVAQVARWRDAYCEAETGRREWRDKCEFLLGMHEGLTPDERTTLEEF